MPTDVTAAQRARWLAELSDTLEEAQRLLWELAPFRKIDLLDLSARLEAANAQARSLRLGRTDEPIHSPPDWTNLPWDVARDDCSVQTP